MTLKTLLHGFAAAVEAGDGHALAACFTEDGIYHDTFYGEFQGREAIADMLENRFWRDADGFRWRFEDVCEAGELGYASWLFGYRSRLEGTEGRRVVVEGMSRFRLRDGLIARYDELLDIAVALGQLDFAPERVARIAARHARTYRDRARRTGHWD